MSPIVTVFGSGRQGPEDPVYQDAVRLGELLGRAGWGVATGGYGGIMEAVLRGAAAFPVRRIGVVTTALAARTVNPYVDEIITVPTYLERLQKLVELGAAYVVFPGGTGTLLELFAVWALRERRLLPDKPIVCLGECWTAALHGLVVSLPELGAARMLVEVAAMPEEAFRLLENGLRPGSR
ncbi:MAG: LOG family protein [Chlorobiota bacterium]